MVSIGLRVDADVPTRATSKTGTDLGMPSSRASSAEGCRARMVSRHEIGPWPASSNQSR